MNFSKIAVALDRSSFDEKLIQYSAVIAKHFGVTSADFLHVVPYYFPPHLIGYDLQKILRKELFLTQEQQRELLNTIKTVFANLDELEVNLHIIEGKPQNKLLTTIQAELPDLLVLGKKQVGGGSGIIAQRIARKVKSAILYVTEKGNTNTQNILVPIDFSSYSLRALQAALHLKEELKEVKITALHLIDVPITAYRINKNKEEIVQQLKLSAEEIYHQFLHRNQLAKTDFEFNMLMNDDFNIAGYVRKIAAKENSDLIITGAKGRSDLNSFVFGSVTEKLVSYRDIPSVLVIR